MPNSSASSHNTLQGWHDCGSAIGYQQHLAALTSACIGSLLDAADVRVGSMLLDVACGNGNATAAAQKRGAHVVGLDFSAAQLRLAAEAGSNLRLLQGNAESLPFASETFDAVTNCFGMPVIVDSDRACAEALRVLKPGGRYAYATWCEASKCIGFAMTYEAVRTHGTLDVGLPSAPSVFACGDLDFAARMLEQAGFSGLSTEEIPLVWHASSPDAIIEAIFDGTVRAATLLRRQAPESRARIRQFMRERIESFRSGEDFAVPIPAVIVAAHRPRR